jgi:hypothetical protein
LLPIPALAEPLYIWNADHWPGIQDKVRADLIELKEVLDFAFDRTPVGEIVGYGGIFYYAVFRNSNVSMFRNAPNYTPKYIQTPIRKFMKIR